VQEAFPLRSQATGSHHADESGAGGPSASAQGAS